MKWALFFCILSTDPFPIQRPEIIKTFVQKGDCIEYRNEKVKQAREINLELGAHNSPRVYLACIPYTGPWKKES